MTKKKDFFDQVEDFFLQKVWSAEEDEISKIKGFFLLQAKILFLFFRGLANKEFLTLASSLTFVTTFSLVPVLALTFSLAKGFGVHGMLEPLIMKQAFGGIADDLIPKIIDYVNNTNVKALGTLGLVFLLLTAVNVLSTIENAFNKIWGIQESRSFFSRFSYYISVLTVGPILIIGAVGFSTTLSSHTVTQKLLEIGVFAGVMKYFILLLPVLLVCAAMTFIYLFVPNTRVRVVPALIAGVVAGVAWQLTQIGYINLQVGVGRYNAIYGTFASVPIFLMWIYISWIIALAGAELSFAVQSVRQFHSIDMDVKTDFAAREKVALGILVELCREFETHEDRLTAADISERINMPLRLINETLSHLHFIGYVLPVEEEGETSYVPAKPIDHMKITDFFLDFKHPGKESSDITKSLIATEVDLILNRYIKTLEDEFKDQSFRDFINTKTKSDKEKGRKGEE